MARLLFGFSKALKETGQALDRLGATLQGNYAYREELSRHRSIMALFGKQPQLGTDVFVAPSASVIGDVKLGNKASVFYGSVLRGDAASIKIGERTNVQDGCVIRTAGTFLADHDGSTSIGRGVTIGHHASLHACTVEDNALIGMGATLLQGSTVEEGAMVAAGAVVPPGMTVPSGEIWGGNPARCLRKLKPEEASFLSASAEAYVNVSAEHLKETSLSLEEIARAKGLTA